MKQDITDTEAYVQTSSVNAVASFLSASLGSLTAEPHPEADIYFFETENTTVVVQPSEAGFLSVSVRGISPWHTCPALGRHLAQGLQCTVRCDPGTEFPAISPYSNIFLQIEGGSESFVSWG